MSASMHIDIESPATGAPSLRRIVAGLLCGATLVCTTGQAGAQPSTATSEPGSGTLSTATAKQNAALAAGGTGGSKSPATATTPSTGGSKSPAGANPAAPTFADKAGAWANFPGAAPDETNAFFQPLGSNGRTCATCHDPRDGWTATPANLVKRFAASNGADPVFLSIDGTNCPTLPVATPAEHRAASSLLLSKGLIRVALTPPAKADFTVSSVTNPYGCNSTAAVSVYRRIPTTTNLAFLSSVMWDGRETAAGASIYADLVNQANVAVATHAAGTVPAPTASIEAAVALELEQFTAQVTSTGAGALATGRAQGGPAALASQAYTPRENTGATPQPVFTIYASWEALNPLTNASTTVLAQASIGRGEHIFNTRPINISGVTGLNDVGTATGSAPAVITGTCGTCHNAQNAGSNSAGLLLDEGQSHASLRTADLPLVTLVHKSDGKVWQVTDPGAALTTGRWADVAKFKVPTLRALAARAPYFHNGSAATLDAVVGFYNTRFSLNLSAQEHADLVNFLGAL